MGTRFYVVDETGCVVACSPDREIAQRDATWWEGNGVVAVVVEAGNHLEALASARPLLPAQEWQEYERAGEVAETLMEHLNGERFLQPVSRDVTFVVTGADGEGNTVLWDRIARRWALKDFSAEVRNARRQPY